MMAEPGAARIGCRLCRDTVDLDDTQVLASAQIAAFVSAHRHFAGLSVALTIRLDNRSERLDHLVDAARAN